MQCDKNFEEMIKYVTEHSANEMFENALENYLQARGLPREANETVLDLKKKFDERELPEFSAKSEYFENNINAIKENWNEFCYAFELMHSEKSKEIFRNLLRAKLFIDTDALAMAYEERYTQYFREDYFEFSPGEVYVDCGAYIGDTIAEFIYYCPDYRKIYAFEASSNLMKEASMHLSCFIEDGSICLFDKAVGDKSGDKLAFSNNLEKGDGKIEIEGTCTVEEVCLDDVLDMPVSFIKIDIEGFEIPAILGAQKTIARNNPKMAICIYHKENDFWEIPQLVLEINPNYIFEITQYRKHEFYDTILYCIPTQQPDRPPYKISESILNQRLMNIRKFAIPWPKEELDLFRGVYDAESWLLKTLATEHRRIYYLEEIIAEKERQNKQNQDVILQMQHAIDELTTWANGLKNQVANCDEQIALKNIEQLESQEQLAINKKLLESLRSTLEEKQQYIDNLNDKMEQLKFERDKLKLENDKLNTFLIVKLWKKIIK